MDGRQVIASGRIAATVRLLVEVPFVPEAIVIWIDWFEGPSVAVSVMGLLYAAVAMMLKVVFVLFPVADWGTDRAAGTLVVIAMVALLPATLAVCAVHFVEPPTARVVCGQCNDVIAGADERLKFTFWETELRLAVRVAF